jgi:RNA-directed DNA polymerase
VKSKAAGERVLSSVTKFVKRKLKPRVNAAKSAVDWPWKRKFLGYSMTNHLKPKLRAVAESVARLKDKERQLWRQSRGRNLGCFIREDLNPVLRGWATYYCLCGVKVIFEELDAWVRRKLRCSQSRQWKGGRTRMKELRKLGLDPERARAGAFNGRGPWWNAKASHMNATLSGKWFRQRERVFKLEIIQRYQKQANS